MSEISLRERKQRLWNKYKCMHANASAMYQFLGVLNAELVKYCVNHKKEWHETDVRAIVSNVHDPFDALDILRGSLATLRTPYAVFNAWMEQMWQNLEEGNETLFYQARASAKLRGYVVAQ